MATKTQDVVFGVTGQSLILDAPEGRPSAVASVTVFENYLGDDDQAETATTGSAAIEADPNTTFDATSGRGQPDERKCSLAATTGIVPGRSYLAVNDVLERELVEVVSVVAGDSVIARHPLENTYPVGSTLQTTRISIGMDATWIADDTNVSWEVSPHARYRVRWVYAVAGVQYVHDTYFDLVRYAGRHDVTPRDVDLEFHGWVMSLPTDYREDQGRAVIDEAYRQVKLDLYGELLPDQGIRNRELLNALVIAKAGLIVFPGTANEDKYRDRFAKLIRSSQLPVSHDSDGGAAPVPALPLLLR
jgi:hypothetical protein